jgi:hypothetical protein
MKGNAGHNLLAVKKEKKIVLLHKKIQKGSGAKSNIRKGFLIYSMRKCANI